MAKKRSDHEIAVVTRIIMPKARSLKQIAQDLAKDRKIQERKAIAYYQERQGGENAVTLRTVSAASGVPRSTLSARINGRQTLSEARESRSHLSKAESLQLVEWLIANAQMGFGLTPKRLKQDVTAFLRIKKGDSNFTPGPTWAGRWLTAYSDLVSPRWSTTLDRVRANASNPVNDAAWFDLVEEINQRYNIQPKNTFSADESNLRFCDDGKTLIIAETGGGSVKKQSHSNRESISVLVTVSAVGKAFRPFVIFKGKNFMKSWMLQGNPLDAV